MWLFTLVKFRYKNCSQRGAFPLPCCPWAGMEGLDEIHTAISSENIQLLQSYIATKKDVYVDYAATADIPQDAIKQYGGETNYYYSYVSQQPSFLFSLVLMGMQDLILLFPSPSFCNFVSFSLAIYTVCYLPIFI